MATSFPKNKIKVLLLENVHSDAQKVFSSESFQVETVAGALDEKELSEKIKGVHVLGIRSKTNVTEAVLENADRLLAIGAFCIGTNQIDLEACSRRGIIVFNAPYSNTRSVVELAIGEIILLMRNLPDKMRDMQNGKWTKSAKNSFEVRHKKLGIIGYGNIGTQLSVVAEALGMEVYFYDIMDKMPLGNATKCRSMEELLQTVDIVTLHVDGRPSNKGFFTAEHFSLMNEGSIFLNLARGPVIDIAALAANMKSGKIIGAGVDVFPVEPKTNNDAFESELVGLPNLIMTPHIGGSTAEAQEHIGNFVPGRIIEYVNAGNTYGSVNFPNLQLPAQRNVHRLIHVHYNKPGVLAEISKTLHDNDCNILGQYLKTTEEIGVVIIDIDQNHTKEVEVALKEIEHTIKFRILY